MNEWVKRNTREFPQEHNLSYSVSGQWLDFYLEGLAIRLFLVENLIVFLEHHYSRPTLRMRSQCGI